MRRLDIPLIFGSLILVIIGLLTLFSFAKFLFPLYFIYVIIGLVALLFFSRVDFTILTIFSKHFYILSILLLLITLLIGQITRGAIRWIPLGPLTIQPSELVRPFLLIFFSDYLTQETLNLKRILKILGLITLPVVLILVQPSLGVAFLTITGFVGIVLASGLSKRLLAFAFLFLVTGSLIFINFLEPYQKLRIVSFLDPGSDPLGSGYNSVQSMISVGSGKLFGRGLGKGVQTQLAFLPEKHTDFIFAAISEELGFIGAFLVLVLSFFILWRIAKFIENPVNVSSRAFLSGVFLTFLVQILINIGMNLGLLPITGLPLPLVSAGGSSLVATMITLGMAMTAVYRQNSFKG